ncbi:MAG: C2H2-type zinc finger protein [Proteobacteria bacterium]|nr:C2H2-type zinc finger protein [Pseudomonadota bacterium]
MIKPFKCAICEKRFGSEQAARQHISSKHFDELVFCDAPDVTSEAQSEETEPDWSRECETCGSTPIVPVTGMCGPCTFGTADAIGGNW